MLEFRKTLDLAPPPEAVWAVIADFAGYREVVPEFREAAVEDRDEGGATVRFSLALPVRTVAYRLRYAMEPPRRLSWTLVDSDLLKANEGEWLLEPQGAGTRLTYVHRTQFPGWIAWAVGAAAYEREMDKTFRRFCERIEGKGPEGAERIRRMMEE
ncbi:MAG: SRPBCC family protein [Planctomycetes bacterium]|jgi:carbon monoxide dehydrogenase subunit G|nr:SRPBCC family protein [Planctomycetota bacterium]